MSKKLKQTFGELEADIMEIIWKLKNASVRNVFNQLKKQRKIAYTTVMTVMDRLYNKGILKRKQNSKGAYIYKANQDRDSFISKASKQAIKNLIAEFGDVAVAQFMNIVDSGNVADLKKWQNKLKKIK